MKKKTVRLPKPAKDRFSDLLLFLFLLFLPVQLGKHFFLSFSYINGVRVDYLAPTIYLTDILALLLLIKNVNAVASFLMIKKVLIILGLLVLNILFSQSKIISLYQFIKIIELLIVFIVFYKRKLPDRLLLITFAFSALIETFLAIQQFINKQSIQGIFYLFGERYFNLSTPGIAKAVINGIEFLRPYGTFSHPNSLAGFYLLIYIFVLTNKRFVSVVWLKILLLFLSTILIFLSFSKIAILTYLILTVLYLLFVADNQCRFCTLAKVAVATVITLLVFQAQTDPLTIQKRIELISNAINIIKTYPIFGAGLGNYLLAQSHYVSRFYLFFNQPVHNIFLLFFSELGLVTGGIIVVLLVAGLKTNWRPLVWTILAIVISGSFDHYWLTLPQNWLLMGTIMAVSLNPVQLENLDEERRK